MTIYRPTEKNADTLSLACIHGRRLAEIVVPAEPQLSWRFEFEGGTRLMTDSLWRIVGRERVEIARDDHDQFFGLAEPVHAGQRALDAIASSPVVAAESDRVTGDLRITFGSGARLEVIMSSCAYESWQLYRPDGIIVVGMGGGDVAPSTPG